MQLLRIRFVICEQVVLEYAQAVVRQRLADAVQREARIQRNARPSALCKRVQLAALPAAAIRLRNGDDGELQALRCMDGHEGHFVLIPFFISVLICQQRYSFEEGR